MFACLWCQIESYMAGIGNGVVNAEGYLIREAYLDRVGKTRGFAEVDEVFKGEGERDRLG